MVNTAKGVSDSKEAHKSGQDSASAGRSVQADANLEGLVAPEGAAHVVALDAHVDHLQCATHDAAQDVAVFERPELVGQFHKVHERVVVEVETKFRVLLPPRADVGSNAQEHLKAYLGDDLCGLAKV